MSAEKAYIGDAVYADVSDGELILTTENGIRATNTIILEPEVLANLLRYISAKLGKSIPVGVVRS